MLKKTKMLVVLFMCSIVLLTGCSNSPIPYKKGNIYKKSNTIFVEVIEDNEWKGIDTYRNKEAFYKIEQMELKAGPYSIIGISPKGVYSNSHPLGLGDREKYYIISPMETGFSLLHVGTEKSEEKLWEKFKSKFEKASDKEAFLKKYIGDNKSRLREYKKTN
ncbi:hypothetical protein CON22_17940 [Bacillus cereus]|nr:hypothetical protein CON22_17940 [Bacillus cereus]